MGYIMKIDKNQQKIRSFGRIKSRKLTENKINVLDNVLPLYQLKEEEINNIFDTKNTIFFEIGFGYGEHTVHQAKLNPQVNIVACETYINGVLSIISKIEKEKINNIKIFNGDTRLLLEKIPNHSIDKIFILFPDPWPKKKQNKRRIINEEFINLVKEKLKIGGILFFASDISNYVEWTFNYASSRLKPLFNNLEDCKKEPEWWIKTRYQEKAIKEGRESYFLEFQNTENI